MRHIAVDQLRPELRQRQALHRRRAARPRRSPRSLSPRCRASEVGDPLAEGTDVGTAGASRSARRAAQAGDRTPLRKARGCSSAARSLQARDRFIRRPCLPMSGRACLRITKSCSDPSRRCLPRATKQMPCASPTTASSGLGAAVFTQGRRARRAGRARARGRVHVRQHARRVRSAAAVRRHQGVGLRTRARHLRHQGVCEHQDGVCEIECRKWKVVESNGKWNVESRRARCGIS